MALSSASNLTVRTVQAGALDLASGLLNFIPLGSLDLTSA